MGQAQIPPLERFDTRWAEGPGGCRIWQGAPDKDGYGRMQVNGRSMYAHVVAWEKEHGPVPEGRELHHSCEVKLCVNEAHLEALTDAEHRQRHLRPACPRGHPYEGKNLYVDPSGARRCRRCNRERVQRRRAAV